MSSPTPAQLEQALNAYPRALTLRAAASKSSADLVELDDWYRTALPDVLAERKRQENNGRSYLEVAELGRLMEWKLAVRCSPASGSLYVSLAHALNTSQRGKWRPRLVTLALSNPAALVRSVTLESSIMGRDEALKHLSTLSGVGPATASAILALYKPADWPFMSDEAMAMGRESFKAEYTVKAWKEYVGSMEDELKSLGWESMADLEKAYWSRAVLRRYGGLEEGDSDAQAAAGKESVKTALKGGKGKRRTEAKEEQEVEADDGEEEIVAKPSSSRAERAAKRVKTGSS